MIKKIAALICAFALSSCFSSDETKDREEAAAYYAGEFGMQPPADVKMLYAKQVFVRDSYGTWLKFNGNIELMESLKNRDFIPTTSDEFMEETGGGNVPSWWTINRSFEFYAKEPWSKEFTYSKAYLAFDREKGEIYFHHDCFD